MSNFNHLKTGLSAPICLTWELTYACNLSCAHCLSSSGRRDPHELSTDEAKEVIDQLVEMNVFYINIGGGEPTIRSDFKTIASYALSKGVGVKFSTNGSRIDRDMAQWISEESYLDVQVSLDGATVSTNDEIRGPGSFQTAITALEVLQSAKAPSVKVSTVITNKSISQLDELYALSASYGAQLRVTRLRPSGRGALTWASLKLSQVEQEYLFRWLSCHRDVLTGDSFFHLSPLGDPLDGLNMCGAGRVVCLIDPVGDVYACPFVIHDSFRAGNLRDTSFMEIWRHSKVFECLRNETGPESCSTCNAIDSCHGGCMATKFFNGLSFDDPDPECVFGRGAMTLSRVKTSIMPDLSRSRPIYIRPNKSAKNSTVASRKI